LAGGGDLIAAAPGGGAVCGRTAGFSAGFFVSSAETGIAQFLPILIAAICPFFTFLKTAIRVTPSLAAASGMERKGLASAIISA